jgi:hypothetical protein
VAASSCFLSGCIGPMYPLGADNEGLVVGRLNTVKPLEIAVPSVINKTGNSYLPLKSLRAEFQRGLVHRRYSPLALEYVDRGAGATEASYSAGSSGEQAVLQVTLTGWDTSRWRSHAVLVVDAEVYLLDATNPDPSQALWGGPVKRTVDLALQRNTFINDQAMLQRAVEETVEGILASLPAREIE